MELTNDSLVKMLPLRHRQENDEETLIGRPDISNFIVLPTFAVEIIEMLDEGKTIGEVAQIMEERFGEPVDVADFVRDLITEYQFVHSVDGVVYNTAEEIKDHFPWISEGLGNFLFNRYAYMLYGAVGVSGAGIILATGKYFPLYSDIFVSSSLTVSALAAIFLGWFFLFLHEMAHLMAARSLGIGSRIGLSHRMFFPVAETNMSNIVLVDPARRYRAYFAGMAWDASFMSVGIWALFAHDLGWWSLSADTLGLIKILNLTFFYGIAFQFMFFMKTDIYYAFTTKYSCNNLLDNTTLYLRKFYRKWSEAEAEEWEGISENEKKVVGWYWLVYLVGFVWAIYYFIAFNVRQFIDFAVLMWMGTRGQPLLSWAVFDGVLLTTLALVPFGILCWSWLRTWKERRANQNRADMMQNAPDVQ
ncbi:PqqD family protein [Brevibacillus dissolubilis]|uniref:PqqD family protein n=1 Tax=Brevibacillus dissolubilis TaxID=1844116 RepID=UPI001116FD11|nr:PqqD family protein [Brevibacillus dissolubilis]